MNIRSAPFALHPVAPPSAAHALDGGLHSDTGLSDDEQFVPLKNAVIMMADDEPITMEVIQTFLEDAGYRNFITTEKSATAMEIIRRERPDVVLLDLMMPEVSGLDILGAMRKEKLLTHIPVLVLTSATDPETKLRVLELGASDFLAKPVDPSELVLRLRNTLAAKAYQDQLAYYDTLTGLPNRRMFLEQVAWALQTAAREKSRLALLHIGLDRFKQINDSLGLAAGDLLLKEVAHRLGTGVRESDGLGRIVQHNPSRHLSRLGGDEFAILLPDIDHVENAAVVARRILSSMTTPFQLAQSEIFLAASIGIAAYPDDGEEAETLLKHAGSATNHAKTKSTRTYQFYSKEINARSLERLNMESSLRRALERDELAVYHQPILRVDSGHVVGTEALLRWNHPQLGLVPPDQFIGLAEDVGLIVPMGEWALRKACAHNQAWLEAGTRNLQVAVNVSARQFRAQDIVQQVTLALEATGMDPRHLKLELTESIVMDRTERSIDTLHQLREMGVRLSVDDFGTGYSSLSYLKRLPLDELKIDRSFLTDIPDDRDATAIAAAIIAIAHSLGLSVVAEGVENEQQLAFLKEKGCDHCQGFLFSKPVPASEFEARLRKHPRRG